MEWITFSLSSLNFDLPSGNFNMHDDITRLWTSWGENARQYNWLFSIQREGKMWEILWQIDVDKKILSIMSLICPFGKLLWSSHSGERQKACLFHFDYIEGHPRRIRQEVGSLLLINGFIVTIFQVDFCHHPYPWHFIIYIKIKEI